MSTYSPTVEYVDPIKQAIARQDAEDRRNARFIRRVLIPVSLIILGALLGFIGANAIHAASDTSAKGTIPACSVYAFTSNPDLHGARSDVCYSDNGDGSWTISTSAYNETLGSSK